MPILNKRDEMRMMRAIRESPHNKRKEEMRARIIAARNSEMEEIQQETDAFRDWERADRFIGILEWIRDSNVPETQDEDWNELFCISVRLLPGARRYAEEKMVDIFTKKFSKGGD